MDSADHPKRSAVVRPKPERVVAGIMVFAHCCLLAWAATRHSPTIDEPPHLAAGLTHLEFGRFDLYNVNPPLNRMIAAIPVALAPHKENWDYYARGGLRPEFRVGGDFIAANGVRSFRLMTYARWACLPFTVIGALVCWRWASELYGERGGLLAVCLWCFGPNTLAHAELVTPDVAATAFGAAAHYKFWHWLKNPSWRAAMLAGLLLGLAEASKATWILLFAAWPAVWLGWRLAARDGCNLARSAFRGMVILILGLAVLNAVYGFDGSFRRLDHFKFTTVALGGIDHDGNATPTGNRFSNTLLGRMPVPLPTSYLLGIDLQRRDFEEPPLRSYLAGTWQIHGWWYFYLYALLLKVPLGTWALLAMTLVATALRPPRGAELRDEIFLLAPAALILVVVSTQTGFSQHPRYVLPIAPFIFIWIGKLAKYLSSKTHLAALCTLGMFLWSAASSLAVYPHSLAYFNELAGGPKFGHNYLVNSSIDWGQDLFYLKDYLDKANLSQPINLAYFGAFHPDIAGIQYVAPPPLPARDIGRDGRTAGRDIERMLKPGLYAVSVNMLRGINFPISDGRGGTIDCRDEPFTYFQRFTPKWRAGYSIYVYELSDDDIKRVARQLDSPAEVEP